MAKTKKQEVKEEFTGRYLVLMPAGGTATSTLSSIQTKGGIRLKNSTEFENEVFTEKDLNSCDGIYLDKLGIAIVNKKPGFENSISAMADAGEVIVEKERVVYAINKIQDESENYIRGYRDAVNALAENLLEEEVDESEADVDGEVDASAIGATWGLKKTRVIPPSFLYSNPWSGLGVKVAILDTGFDFNHPDFIGRPIVHQSFIPGQTTQDVFGHGTHCTGTACGPKNPPGSFERYGIAYNAKIYIGKVLNNSGSGSDGQILAGINWAYGQGCKIISMSLGGATSSPGFSAIFENTALNLLNNGVLIIAAAGNDSNRPSIVRPVSHPANCPSIMAVGAVDASLNIAYFSNGGLFPTHGAVDIVGPGVGVFSALSTPHNPVMGAPGLVRGNCNGTSMAAPHVAGIAALWAQRLGISGKTLWKKLIDTAKPLPHLPVSAVGAGLVQAPNKKLVIFPRRP